MAAAIDRPSFTSTATFSPAGSASTASAKRGGWLPSARTRSRSKDRARRQRTGNERAHRPPRDRVVGQHRDPVPGEPHVDLDGVGTGAGRADDAGQAVLGVVQRQRAVGDDEHAQTETGRACIHRRRLLRRRLLGSEPLGRPPAAPEVVDPHVAAGGRANRDDLGAGPAHRTHGADATAGGRARTGWPRAGRARRRRAGRGAGARPRTSGRAPTSAARASAGHRSFGKQQATTTATATAIEVWRRREPEASGPLADVHAVDAAGAGRPRSTRSFSSGVDEPGHQAGAEHGQGRPDPHGGHAGHRRHQDDPGDRSERHEDLRPGRPRRPGGRSRGRTRAPRRGRRDGERRGRRSAPGRRSHRRPTTGPSAPVPRRHCRRFPGAGFVGLDPPVQNPPP